MIHDWEAKSRLTIALCHLEWIKGYCEIQIAGKIPGWETLKVIESKVDRALADLSEKEPRPTWEPLQTNPCGVNLDDPDNPRWVHVEGCKCTKGGSPALDR